MATKWANSFWSCFDPIGTCGMACCCPCFLFGKTKARRTDPSLQSYSAFNGACIAWYALACCGVQGIYQTLDRTELRDQYSIEGSQGIDLLASCCCPCCGLVQQEKEVIARNNAQSGLGAQAGYVQKPGMGYPA